MVVVLASMLAGCGGSAPSPPTPTQPSAVSSPAGKWSGTMRDPVAGEGTLRMSLADQSGTLVGTWSAALKNGQEASGRSVATLVRAGTYGIILYADPTACATTGESGFLGYTLINVVATSQRLTGVLGRMACSGPVFAFGSVDLSKQ